MKIHPAKQGSPEWIAARIGLPTASNFDRLISPKTGKPSSQIDRYVAKLAAEWYLGISLDEATSGFMERGSEMEAQAVAWYEWERDVTTEKVGLCLRDDERVGASPDRLVGTDGLLEIKCPSAEVHMSYVLGGPPDEYKPQVQGQLWITGRKWADLLSYHPTLPRVLVRVERDPEYIDALAGIVDGLLARLDEAKARLADAKAEYDANRAAESEEQIPAGIS